MKKRLCVAVIVCLSVFNVYLVYADDYPDPGLDPNYQPENVTVGDENMTENTVPANESEVDEKDSLENDEAREDKDYDEFEGRAEEIQDDLKKPID